MSFVVVLANIHTFQNQRTCLQCLRWSYCEWDTRAHTYQHGHLCTHTQRMSAHTMGTFERLYCCGFIIKLTASTNGTLNETSWICQITIKKTHTHTYTQLTTHLHIASKTVFCVSIVSIWISIACLYTCYYYFFFLHVFFLAVVNVRFRVIPTKERSLYAVEIKFQTIEKVKLVGSELLRRQERYL